MWRFALLAACPFLLGPLPEVRKLNLPLAQPAVGQVTSASPSPDGAWVVHTGDLDTDGVIELYSAPADGSAPAVKLSPPSIVGDVFEPVLISADGTRVVYRATQEDVSRTELYSVAIDGSAASIKLNGTLVAGGDVQPEAVNGRTEVAISPDGTRVVYLADQDTNEVFELYSVPIDRSQEPVKLNGPMIAGGDVYFFGAFWIDPGGTRVVYLADQDANDVFELYSVPIDGSQAPVKLNAPLDSGGNVLESLVSPDGLHVVYRADQDQDGIVEAFSVPLDGSQAPTKLHADLGFGSQVSELQITSDGSRVILRGNLPPTVFRTKLFSVPIDASQPPLEISGTLGPGRHVQSFVLSPDGEHAVYYADQDTDEVFELYSVPTAGGQAPIKLNHVLPTGFIDPPFRVTPDSARLLYSISVAGPDLELYSVPLDRASEPVLLCGGEIPGATVSDHVCSPDGATVVFVEDRETNDVHELYRVPSDGNAGPQKLSGLLFPRGDVSYPLSQIAGDRVAYRADQDTNSVFELYSVPIDGSEPSTKLNSPVATGSVVAGDVLSARISPDSRRAVYVAMQGQSDLQLFSAPLDVDAPPVRINDDFLADGALVDQFEITPDGDRLVFSVLEPQGNTFSRLYVAPIDGSSTAVELSAPGSAFTISPDSSTVVFNDTTYPGAPRKLFSVPSLGGAPPVEINGSIVAGGSVSGPVISPDGTLVVFRGDRLVDEHFELFSVPIDGSQEPVKISGEPVLPHLPVELDYSISSTGLHVVYRRSGNLLVTELYSTPIDGSASPVVLNGALAAGGDVVLYRISPDGGRVVYRADQSQDEVFELFSRPIDASASAVKLNGALPAGADVENFLFTQEGSVLYLADQESDGRYGIFHVPIDGSSSPEQIHPPMVPSGNPRANFRLSADGAWVVYTADAFENGVFQLFSVPLAGGAPVTLSGALVPAGDVFDDFAISPDGSHVVYRADQETDMVNELFRVPIDGRRAARKVNSPLIPTGDVVDFAVGAGAARVVYRADQDSDEVIELYLSAGSPALQRFPGPVEVR